MGVGWQGLVPRKCDKMARTLKSPTFPNSGARARLLFRALKALRASSLCSLPEDVLQVRAALLGGPEGLAGPRGLQAPRAGGNRP